VAARAAAARRGEARRSQREAGERRRGCRGGTWHGLGWRGAVCAWHMAGKSGGGASGRETEEPGLEEEDEDCSVIFQKCRDLTIMIR
jgi:hypothetical protein